MIIWYGSTIFYWNDHPLIHDTMFTMLFCENEKVIESDWYKYKEFLQCKGHELRSQVSWRYFQWLGHQKQFPQILVRPKHPNDSGLTLPGYSWNVAYLMWWLNMRMQIPTSNLDVAFSVAFRHPSTIQPGCTHICQREVIWRSISVHWMYFVTSLS